MVPRAIFVLNYTKLFLFPVPPMGCGFFVLCSTSQMWVFLFSVPPIRCDRFVLCSTNQMWLLLMGKEWRSAVSRIIERLGREGQYKLTYSPATSLSVEVVVALEAAKRISFTRKVKATCTAKKVQSCLQYVK